ncbi:antitoxin HipB [Clostridium puniceum]|uniref:Antitoxin HipB n=1 Tax=Clostridium puniceum TaxID=29367 RepID=A0A1S8TWE5_9CLOT|nr:helix-turn-helix transcriptional regulator [Clostridium puniceum]OOM81902.1 antitoxin HipB [Clostridium puniceum]
MELSEALKMIRSELGITQEELAKEVHVSFSTVNRWENNKSIPNPIGRVVLLDFFQKRKASSYLIEELKKCK